MARPQARPSAFFCSSNQLSDALAASASSAELRLREHGLLPGRLHLDDAAGAREDEIRISVGGGISA